MDTYAEKAIRDRNSKDALTSICAWSRLERLGLATTKPTGTGVHFTLNEAGQKAAADLSE